MADDAQRDPSDVAPPAPSARDDLAAGLGLVLRAARRALRDLETAPVDELGRKAMQGVERGAEAIEELARKAVDKVEAVDRTTAREMGKKAVEALDPRNLEQLAGSAGSELVGAVERVVGRVESFVSEAVRQAKSEPPPAQPPEPPPPPEGGEKPAP
ncbi:MAG: hypothetical protein IT376_10625 [Polyangiaceae bacterium]|nr:hypothetical protein [Polyangiaceae bacterium]